MTTSRSNLIRVASTLPKGSEARIALLEVLGRGIQGASLGTSLGHMYEKVRQEWFTQAWAEVARSLTAMTDTKWEVDGRGDQGGVRDSEWQLGLGGKRVLRFDYPGTLTLSLMGLPSRKRSESIKYQDIEGVTLGEFLDAATRMVSNF